MTGKLLAKYVKNLLLSIIMQPSVTAGVFGNTLSAMKLAHKPIRIFKTVLLNGIA